MTSTSTATAICSVSLEENPLKVVIGPDGNCYVVDGHHHWKAAAISKEHEVSRYYVQVVEDARTDLENFDGLPAKERAIRMRDFWVRMVREKRAWLYDAKGELLPWVDSKGGQSVPLKGKDAELFARARTGQELEHAAELLDKAVKAHGLMHPALPETVRDTVNDPYRALAKFVEEAKGYEKGKTPWDQLFQEFYWARELRTRVRLPEGRISASQWSRAIQEGLEFAASDAASDLPGALKAPKAPDPDAAHCVIAEIVKKFGL